MGDTPKKYHITDNGDIYKVNDDGSFTSMGNAEKMSSTNQTEKTISQSTEPSADDKPIKPLIEKKHRGLVIGVIISVILLGGSSLFYLLNSQKMSNVSKEEDLSLDAIVQSISKEPLVENEQQITEEQSVISQDNSQSEITKVESHQLTQPIVKEPERVSENYVKSSDSTNNARKGVKTGMRHGEPLLLRVASQRMASDGYSFYERNNGLWLTHHVPVNFLEIVSV